MHGLDGLWTALIAITAVLGLVGAYVGRRQIGSWFRRSAGPQVLKQAIDSVNFLSDEVKRLNEELSKANERIAVLEDKNRELTELLTSAGRIEALTTKVEIHHEQVMAALEALKK